MVYGDQIRVVNVQYALMALTKTFATFSQHGFVH